MSTNDLVLKLKENLLSRDSAGEYHDHNRDMIAFCLANAYTRADLIENSKYGDSRIEEVKFNRRLDAIMLKRENIPTCQDVTELTNHMNTQRISYQSYIMLGECMPPTVRSRYFTAAVFETFNRDAENTIDTEEFLKYVQRSVDVETVEVELASYANTYLDGIPVPPAPSSSLLLVWQGGRGCHGEPYVTEQELERFIFDSIPHIPLVMEANLHESFLPFYVFAAVRRLLFYLDPQRTRRVNIRKLSHSQEMEEFLWLQRLDQYRDDYEDESAFQRQVASNWFSAENAMRLYDVYVSLDKDGNGMLNQKELLQFHGDGQSRGQRAASVQLTPLVISRIFEENITYQPAEMDFKTFLDLVLALENREHVESLRYLWRVIDINKDNLLTRQTIQLFYRDIRTMLLDMGYDAAPSENDVCVEILDMLGNPQERISTRGTGGGVTFKQLLASGQASTVISMLIDIHKFWAYDNRESLANSYDDDDDGEGQGEIEPDGETSNRSDSGLTGATNEVDHCEEHFEGAKESDSDGSQNRPNDRSKTAYVPLSMRSVNSTDQDDEDDPYDFY